MKAGGVLLILMGVLMLTGKMNAVTGYLSRISQPVQKESVSGEETAEEGAAGAEETAAQEETAETQEASAAEEVSEAAEETESAAQETGETTAQETAERPKIPAPDFTLTDQFGNTHTLEDYRGKTIFLNFWATWCPPCRAEMPDIQALYENREEEGKMLWRFWVWLRRTMARRRTRRESRPLWRRTDIPIRCSWTRTEP